MDPGFRRDAIIGMVRSMEHTTSLMQDLSRGFACKCPHCGDGKLFATWLKVVDRCEKCGEEFHHHRADDFPAYVVILVLGHVMVTYALWLEEAFSPPMWVHVATTLPLAAVLGLWMLQPIKGAIVALQWRIGMHGFRISKEKRSGGV